MRNKEHYCQECMQYSKHELSQQGWLCDECNDKFSFISEELIESKLESEQTNERTT